jgi:hypothetical protein
MQSMQRFLKVLTIIGLTSAVGSSARHVDFQWPDSSHYWRALVNVNQYIETYLRTHPQWFSQDRLATDFAVQDVPAGGQEAAAERYKKVRKMLESKKMWVGTYVSGTTVLPESEENHYPYSAVPIEQLPATTHYSGSWPGHPSRRTVDISDAGSRRALELGIRRLWEKEPAPLRFIDNMPPHPRVLKTQPWETSCKYIQELREMGESLGSVVIFNIAMHVGALSDQDTRQLIQAVGHGGICLEMPWSATIRRDQAATKEAERRYLQLLDSGMAIVMIAVKTPEGDLKHWVQSWRRPEDHVYLGAAFFKPPDPSIYMLQ